MVVAPACRPGNATAAVPVRDRRGWPWPLIVALLCLALPISVACQTLRVANQGDVLSLDPHAQNEGLQLDVLYNVFEPLVGRDAAYQPAPALATRWRRTAPTVWRFELREGVRFHDGTPFTADDAVFSLERARQPGSAVRALLANVVEVRPAGAAAVTLVTRTPDPILPQTLFRVYMMSRRWCETHQAVLPADRMRGQENAASFAANGTGPYQVQDRRGAGALSFDRHASYWGEVEGNVAAVRFTPIAQAATRLAALRSGEVDVIDPLPLQDVDVVRRASGFRVLQRPELRVLFLGMDQRRDELLYANVKGRNPFRDRRVRQALLRGIDADALRLQILRGAASAATQLVPPEVSGHAPGLASLPRHDPREARALLAQAGFAGGFAVKLNCPNDRYLNDAALCQALAAQLARIGIEVAVEAETKALYFSKLLRRDTSFYLLGWASATGDALSVLQALAATPAPGGIGQWNLGSWSQPKFDALLASAAQETDAERRLALLHEAAQVHADDIGHIPLYQQPVNWGVRAGIELVQWPDGSMPWRFARISQ